MTSVLAALVVVTFALLLERFGVLDRARDASERAQHGFRVMRNPELDDAVKERALRRSAIELFGLAATIGVLSALALCLPLAVVRFLEYLGIGSTSDVLHMLQRIDFLALATVLGFAAYYAVGRFRTSR